MLLCSLVQFARIVIVRVILVGVLGVMIVVLIGLDEVLVIVVIYVAIFVVIFCNWRCTLYRLDNSGFNTERNLAPLRHSHAALDSLSSLNALRCAVIADPILVVEQRHHLCASQDVFGTVLVILHTSQIGCFG